MQSVFMAAGAGRRGLAGDSCKSAGLGLDDSDETGKPVSDFASSFLNPRLCQNSRHEAEHNLRFLEGS
jgi:hypothetical protein